MELDDPYALDILQKINMTKLQIEQIRQMENHSSFVEERRQIAIDNLQLEIVAWELFYEEYTGDAVYQRAIADKPEWVQGVFWDLFNYKAEKIQNGTVAQIKAYNSGASKLAQQYAFAENAAITKQEMIAVNAQANINHKLAIPSQQEIMFDDFGRFINSTEVQEKLNRYYTDYKADPDYIVANLDDTYAYNSTKADVRAEQQCDTGKVLVYRSVAGANNHDSDIAQWVADLTNIGLFHEIPNEYLKWACLTPETAEIWIVRGLAKF
jgi:hypothetical protein